MFCRFDQNPVRFYLGVEGILIVKRLGLGFSLLQGLTYSKREEKSNLRLRFLK